MSDAYRPVQCTRCGCQYVCTPAADFYDPNPELGWTDGKVCLSCLLALSRANGTQQRGGRLT